MINKLCINNILESDDPLSEVALEFLTSHKEEDLFVDYKESFNEKDEKEWLGITTDAMAFANTMGGFIIFGIKDGDFEITGLPDYSIKILTNTNLILQKLNRYISPHFSSLRTKEYSTDAGKIAIMYIPESKGKTHIFIKDVTYKYPNGNRKKLISTGMIYVRRSAANQVLMPEDFEFIINRRIEYFKDSILSKISKVIEAPPEHNVIIFDPKPLENNSETFSITDSDGAIPIKGMSFTIAPSTDIEELCGWISLSKRDSTFLPSHARLWYIYSKRETLALDSQQLFELIRFSLLLEHPIFYWIKNLDADEIMQKLVAVFNETQNFFIISNCLRVSAFLGKSYFRKFRIKTASLNDRLEKKYKKFPHDPFELFHKGMIETKKTIDEKQNENEFRKKLESELSQYAKKFSEKKTSVLESMNAIAIDCYLYARTDKYKKRSES